MWHPQHPLAMTFTTCCMKNHLVDLNLASMSFTEKGKNNFLQSPQFNSWFLRLLTSPSVIFLPAWEVLTLLVNFLHQSCSVSLTILVALNWGLSSVLGRRRGLHIAFKMWMQAGFTQYHDNLFWFTLYSSSSNHNNYLFGSYWMLT